MFLKKLKNNFDFILTSFILKLKVLKEYKVNLWSSVFVEFFYIITYIIFFYVIASNFKFLEWNFRDFIFFFVIISLLNSASGTFVWEPDLKDYITRGFFNNLLIKPKNTLYLFYFIEINSNAIIMFFIDIIFFLLVLIIFKIKLYHLFLGFLFLVLLLFYIIFFESFFYSLDFIVIGLHLIFTQFFNVEMILEKYPAIFFKDFSYKILLNLLPAYFIATILIPILRNKISQSLNLIFQIKLFFGSFIFFILGTIIVWHYGLKKYSAYG